ncbi:MAG: DUF5666 domain-containing protein [Acidimicrobiales bacterium]
MPEPGGDDDFWGDRGAPAPVDASAAAASAAPKPRRHWVIGAAAAVAVAAGVGLFAVKSGSDGTTTTATSTTVASPRRGGRGTVGQLTAVDGATLTLTSRDGTAVKVTTSEDTMVTRAVPGTLAEVKVGDNVVVTGTSAAAGSITAARVVDSGTLAPGSLGGRRGDGADAQSPAGLGRGSNGAPAPGGTVPAPGAAGNGPPPGGFAPGAGGGFVAGAVQSVSGSSFVVSGRDGTMTTVATANTTVVSVVKPAALGDLALGKQVAVAGPVGGDGTVAATSVRQGGDLGPGGGRGPGATTTPPTTV